MTKTLYTARLVLDTGAERSHGDPAYIVIHGKKITVSVRVSKSGRWLKLRASGRDGQHLPETEGYLTKNPRALERLMDGKEIPA